MTDPADKDQVFAKPLRDVKAFEFNENVASVFQDMITRSVPGYELLLQMIGLYPHNHRLKRLFQKHKIPPWKRSLTPQIYMGVSYAPEQAQ